MKHPSRFFTLSPPALGVLVLVALGSSSVPAFARKKNNAITQLQIWPGQRVLIVLPLSVNANFLNSDSESSAPTAPLPTPVVAAPVLGTAPVSPPADGGVAPAVVGGVAGGATPAVVGGDAPVMTAAPDAGAMAGVAPSGQSELANALVPLVSSGLSRALQNTGKFSLVLPYRFDPLLRRALSETAQSQVSDEDVNAFVSTPTLAAAQTMLPKLSLDQPGMVAQVVLENLQVGGTPQDPTVQVRMHGDLYQVEVADPAAPPRNTLFRSITVTSKAFPGRTPEDRLRAATSQAFNDIAAAFVEPPTEFQLPIPVAPPTPTGGTTGVGTSGGASKGGASKGGSMTPGRGMSKPGTGGGTMAPLTPATPGAATITPPNRLSPQSSGPVAPVLPPATPPLGLNVPTQGG